MSLVFDTKSASLLLYRNFRTKLPFRSPLNSVTPKSQIPSTPTDTRPSLTPNMLSSCQVSRRRRQFPRRSFFEITNTTQCDTSSEPSRSPSRNNLQCPSPDNPYKDEIDRLQTELEEPCKTCLYTGVATCTGLSLYFAKLAIEDGIPKRNQRFLLAFSAAWVVAGAARWQMG